MNAKEHYPDKRDAEPRKTWDSVAELYKEKYNSVQIYDKTYQAFCSHLTEKDAKVLEGGCGPGTVTGYLRSHRPDLIISAFDYSKAMVKLARETHPGISFFEMDCRDIHLLPEHYNGILLGFCIPYLPGEDVNQLINSCYKKLKANGILYISWIIGPHERSGYELNSTGKSGMAVYYYEMDTLKKWMVSAGLTIGEEFIIRPGGTGHNSLDHGILIGKKAV